MVNPPTTLSLVIALGDGALNVLRDAAPVLWGVPVLCFGAPRLPPELPPAVAGGTIGVLASLGGNTGTRLLPQVLARLAEFKLQPRVITLLPFAFEALRLKAAEDVLLNLAWHAIRPVVLPNQDIYRLPGDRTFAEAFSILNRRAFAHLAYGPGIPTDIFHWAGVRRF